MVEYFEIGHITNTHGLKGELKVKSFSEDYKMYEKLKYILIDINGELKKYFIQSVRYQKDKDIVLLKLKDIDNINEAEKLKNYYIKTERNNVRKLKEEEYFVADLIGSNVYENDNLIGILNDIFSTGASDVYVIKRKIKKDLLLPAISSVVKRIDVAKRRIDVEIPRGLDDEI